jgi:hypothetical protein
MKSLLSVGSDADKRPTVPTLRQWLKTVGNGKIAQRHIVTTIWRPNQFPNYTFITEYYKVRISENNPIYKELHQLLGDWYDQCVPIAISVGAERDGAFDIVEAEGENVEWRPIGETGYEIKVLAKRDSAKPVGGKPKAGA